MTIPDGYYNHFDASKNYYEVMALAGYVEQSREDNEIQAILMGALKKGMDTLYKNDTLISGGELGRGPGQFDVSLGAAKFYHNGIVHSVAAATGSLSGTGTETVGVLVTETLVGPNDDPDLFDPASGSDNYGQPGAWRRKIVCTWAINNPVAIPLYTFVGNVQQTQPLVGNIDLVTKELARRTYDESGNYVVAGFDLQVVNNDDNTLNVVVGSKNPTPNENGSKAYVQGNKIIKIAPEKLVINKAKDPRAVVAQPFFYDGSSPTFTFRSQPAFKLDQVTAIYDVVRTVSSHNYNGYDELIQAGEVLVDVISAFHSGTPEAPVTVYAKAANRTGTGDYYIGTDVPGGIKWDVAGSSTDPVSAGDTYYVYCLVRRVVDLTSTAAVIQPGSGGTVFDITAMNPKPYRLNRATGAALSSEIDVSYQYYLNRVDTST
jgi:hypothetical protein